MRVTITDKEAIGALRPLSVVGYLRAKGWTKYNDMPKKFSVWHHAGSDDAEIVVPATKNGSDFELRLSLMLAQLSEIENRSQYDIIRDMLSSGFDIIRIRISSPSVLDGSIRIAEGVRVVHEAKEILLAAACAAVRPSSVFHTRKPQRAMEYLDDARLGQTQHGSFVLNILSPVTPQLNAHSDTDLFPEDPYERRVVKTLAASVNAAASAAAEAATATQPDFASFQTAVTSGVSANLCEGVSRLFKASDAESINISVGWAQTRPVPEAEVPASTTIAADVIPTIDEAARIFRARDTLRDYVVSGPVIKLERAEGAELGQATIFAQIEDSMRKVLVTLGKLEYDKATLAHRDYSFVTVVGNVRKNGRSYQVEEPKGFDFLAEDDAAD